MSLINDALKRAATEKPRDTNPSAPVPPLQPVDPAPAPRNSPVLLAGVLLLGLGAVGIAAALWFNGRTPASTPVAANTTPAQTHNSANPAIEANPPTQNPLSQAAHTLQAVTAHNETTPQPAATPVPQPNPQPNPQSVPQPAAQPTTRPASPSVSTPTPQSQTIASAPSTAGTAPTLPPSQPVAASTATKAATPSPAASKPIRLQSIFYRLKSPTVIINGKTLAVGDSVDGAKVVSIQRTSVEIVQNGKYRTLTID